MLSQKPASSRTLFQLADDVLALDALLSSVGGEVTDEEAEAALDAYMLELEGDLQRKADAYVLLIAELDARAEARSREAERLKGLAQSDAANSERLRARLKQFFERTGRERLETERFKISLVRQGGKLPLKLHCPPEDLPEEFRTAVVSYKANQEAIREALGRGDKLIFAELGERGTSLRIR